MKRITYLAITLLLFSFLVACTDRPTSASSDPKLDDLDYFCNTLEKRHKNLYAKITKQEFEKEKQMIADKAAEMSDSDFYYSLKHLLSIVGDAHTDMSFSDSQYQHLNALGFAVEKYSDGWHLMMLEKKNEQYLGCSLLAINNMDINDVFNRAKEIMSFENETWAENSFSNTINFREPLEFLDIVEKDEPITLTIEDSNGEEQFVELHSMNEQEILAAEILSVTQKIIPQTVLRGIYSSMPLDQNCLYIQYNSCQEAPDLPMKEFISIVSDDIKESNYNKVIIDLRYNTGGNSRVFEPMIKELSKLQKESKFKVYTLIGKNTFSSAIINAIQIKDQLECILVGTPTGGNVNGYGELKNFSLKNHPITVWYSTKYFELIKGYEKASLYPDILVEHNFEDYINGVDKEVQTIMED